MSLVHQFYYGAAAGLTMLVVKSAGFTSVVVGLPSLSTVSIYHLL